MNATVRTTQDEHYQHAVVITFDGQPRVYCRHYSAHVIAAIARTVRRDGYAAQRWVEAPAAEYRTTKAGKRLLVAADVSELAK